MPTMCPVEQTLLGNAELAAALGVSRQRITQLVGSPDFPAPRARLAMGAVWELLDVAAWAEAHARTLNQEAIRPGGRWRESSLPGGSSSGTAESAVQRSPSLDLS